MIIVAKGNPLGIKSYDDLKGKKVGSISGSAADSYLGQIGVKSTPFKTEIDELQSLNQGRLEAVLEDDLVYLEFAKSNQNNNLEPLWSIAAPAEIINGGGYGMARFALRKEDCTLRVGLHAGAGGNAGQRPGQLHPEEIWPERPQPRALQAGALSRPGLRRFFRRPRWNCSIPQVAVENLGPLLAGLLMTIELTFVVIVLSLVFALFVALGGMSRWRLLRWLIKAYIEVMRGTPLLLQLIYIYYVLPEIGIRLDAFTAGVDRADAELLGLSLRSVSRRHPGGAERPARCGRGARHDPGAGDAPHHPAAGDPHRYPDAGQLLHLAVQGYRAVLGRKHPGSGVHRADPRRAQLPILHAVYRRGRRCISLVSFPAARLVGWLERRHTQRLSAPVRMTGEGPGMTGARR